jgi:hypothetical protein
MSTTADSLPGVRVPQSSRALEVGALLGASVLGTVGRFLLLRGWVFAARPHRKDI